jgi:hypothetical protein
MIDIGRTRTSSSDAYNGAQGVNASSRLLGQQNNHATPLSYSTAYIAYCYDCGEPRNEGARFCSFCGRSLIDY